MTELDIDNLASRLLNVGAIGDCLTTCVNKQELTTLCFKAKQVFMSQNSLIEIYPPVVVCGDIHGQYSDLLRIFDKNGFPPEVNYLFLGDYVDRGRQNIETICLMFCLKIKYPENFFMLRGNHECPAINRVYGFYEECNRRYKSSRLWSSFQDTFNWMPLCGLIGGRILCMHGGLSPHLQSLDQLRQLPRPQDPPNPSMGIDLLWAVPDPWGWQANTRGVSYVFGQDVVLNVCDRWDIDLIARAHQVVQDGYEFFAAKKMVTIFSAPQYCGHFNNFAATMTVNEELVCSFNVYKPRKTARLAAKPRLSFDFVDKKKITRLRGVIDVIETDGFCYIRSRDSHNALKLVASGADYTCARKCQSNCTKSAALARPVTKVDNNKCVVMNVILPNEENYVAPPDRSKPKSSREVGPHVDCSAPFTMRNRVVPQ